MCVMKALTIGALAKQSGVNLQTVRFYERRGLLPKPPRSKAGYRLYSTDARRRLRFIKRAQGLGFSLSEVQELLSLQVSRRTTCADIRKRAKAKVAEIAAKIRMLEAMLATLQKLTEACEAGGTPLSECPILEALEDEQP